MSRLLQHKDRTAIHHACIYTYYGVRSTVSDRSYSGSARVREMAWDMGSCLKHSAVGAAHYWVSDYQRSYRENGTDESLLYASAGYRLESRHN